MLLSEYDYNVNQLNDTINTLSGENSNAHMTHYVKKWARAKQSIFELFGGQLTVERPVQSFLSKSQIQNTIGDFLTLIRSNSKLALVYFFLTEDFLSHEEIAQNYLNKNVVFLGTRFNSGMKISRILPRLVPKSHSEWIQIEYSKIVQSFSFTGTAVLSIDPKDYITMSENSSGWRSCHALDGEYRTGTLAYMLDTCSVVAYVKTKDMMVGSTTFSDKLWRQMVLISTDERYAIQSRQYPNTNSSNAGTISDMLISLWGEDFHVVKQDTGHLERRVEDNESGTRMWYNDITNGGFNRGRIVMSKQYSSIDDFINKKSQIESVWVGVEDIPCPCACGRYLESPEYIYYESNEDNWENDEWDDEEEERIQDIVSVL